MLNFLYRLKVEMGLQSVQMARAPYTYYQWSLEQRRDFLQAPSVNALCKTIIMKNSEYNEEYAGDESYPRFIMVIVQYSAKLVSQRIAAIMKEYQRQHTKAKPVGKKYFKFRLAHESDAF
jgi:hypothetical protein